MKIQAAIFDIGNVLLRFDYMRSAWRLQEKNKLVDLPDRGLVVRAQHDYESGLLDREAFLETVRPAFRDSGDPAGFVAIWEDIFDENLPMTALARSLSERMPVYLLSNISDIHIEYIHRKYDVFRVFSDAVYSCKARLMKPDPGIFHHAAAQFGVDPAETIYFDDMPENCEAAASVGYIVHQYDHARHAEAERWLAEVLT
jgi:putative hydrolase of the HAD superfamily